MSLLVIVPSRGRPENIERLQTAFLDTAEGPTALMVGVDDDDPTLAGYRKVGPVEVGPRERMAGTLNRLAVREAPRVTHIGFMGDDHLPRSAGWDRAVTRELDLLGTGIVYGNDLLQGALLPTAVFMSSDIVRATGWMALPGARHLWLDNAWKSLGERLGAITYLPEVIIEHVHPVAGKTAWDDGYKANNDHETSDHDHAVYQAWLKDGLDRDVAKIRAFSG